MVEDTIVLDLPVDGRVRRRLYSHEKVSNKDSEIVVEIWTKHHGQRIRLMRSSNQLTPGSVRLRHGYCLVRSKYSHITKKTVVRIFKIVDIRHSKGMAHVVLLLLAQKVGEETLTLARNAPIMYSEDVLEGQFWDAMRVASDMSRHGTTEGYYDVGSTISFRIKSLLRLLSISRLFE